MRSNSIRLLHDDYGSAVATWFKAICLMPFWFIPWLFPIGLLCRILNAEVFGLSFIFSFGFLYFARDLMRKRIIIDDKKISCGLQSLLVENIEKVVVRKDWFKLERILVIQEAGGKSLALNISKIPAEDFECLIDVLQRRAPNVEIDSKVDSILRYKKWQPTHYQETTSTVSIDYHPNRGWENLPKYFGKSFSSWGRYIGPVGTVFITLPIWLTVNTAAFKLVQDYSRVSEHQELYDFLVAVVNVWLAVSGQVVVSTSTFLFNLASHPAAIVVGLIVSIFLIVQLLHAVCSANRITIDSNELSLDRWGFFSSYNTGSVKWNEVTEIGVEIENGESFISLKLNNDNPPFRLALQAIDGADAPRLLQAFKRFAPDCTLSPELIELLEPSAPKSYTQLWLQSLTAAPQRKNLEPLKPGAMLDNSRYEVIRRLGVGGQGTAYLCYDLSRDETRKATTVALKETIIPVFVENVVRQKTIEQFLTEVELLSSIECDGVVRLIDHFVDDHRAYLVLEHVEGLTLREWIAEKGPMSADEARPLVEQMCEILAQLHSKNVIHRDFAPDNLILTPEGKLKLIDFNVAQTISDGSTDTIVGKHAYVPPEQFRGKPTSQSDIYALGATTYFLLTGQDPEPISQSSLPPELAASAGSLGSIIQQCTRLSLSDRVRSVEGVMKLLAEEMSEEKSSDSNVIELAEKREEMDEIKADAKRKRR